jgi:hypothetical protein
MPPVNASPLDVLIPIIVMFVKQSGFPAKWNALLALAVYAIWTAVSLSLGLRAISGPLTFDSFYPAFIAALSTGYVSYQLFYRGLLEDKLTYLTSFVKGPVSAPIDTGTPDLPATPTPTDPAPAPAAPTPSTTTTVGTTVPTDPTVQG